MRHVILIGLLVGCGGAGSVAEVDNGGDPFERWDDPAMVSDYPDDAVDLCTVWSDLTDCSACLDAPGSYLAPGSARTGGGGGCVITIGQMRGCALSVNTLGGRCSVGSAECRPVRERCPQLTEVLP